tara:strand:- start:826 stop:1380 length:555 start_codon:yes stop_codon:yes gene_type:complete
MPLSTSVGLTIISGPASSGKSIWAEKLLSKASNVYYIATSPIYENDIDWQRRIQIHKSRRPSYWNLIETPVNLADTINNISNDNYILVDSLGGFVSNHIDLSMPEWMKYHTQLITQLSLKTHNIIIVIEEVGWGICPPTKLGNIFRDRMGLITQELEEIANTSLLIIHGNAIDLKKLSLGNIDL